MTAQNREAIEREIEQYAIRYARQKAKELVGHFGFTKSDRDDIEQELLLDLLERSANFDPQRAEPRAFITLVVQRKISTLIRRRLAEKRRFDQVASSLDDEAAEEVMTRFRTGEPTRIDQDFVDLQTDVESVLERLPPDLRELCEHLKSKTLSEISRELGIPRSTLAGRVKKLRRRFEDAGLRDYL
jgi:RNA polymerase sigma-70 factor (ECF subfamily)